MENSDNKVGKIISYAGWAIGLVGLLITIYTAFIKKDKPNFEYQVVSSTRFINENESSTSIKVFVDSIDVQANHLNISAFNIRVENSGSAHIRYDDYDNGEFGLLVSDGVLLEQPVLLASSNDHIRSLFDCRDSSFDTVFINIPHLSLDIDDFYVIRVVVLHNADVSPHFLPIGKIVGQKDIIFNTLLTKTPGFWPTVFNGNVFVHLVRFILYLSLIALLVFIWYHLSQIKWYIKVIKRKMFISSLTRNKDYLRSVCDDYIDRGDPFIQYLYDLFNENESVISARYDSSKGLLTKEQSTDNNGCKEQDEKIHDYEFMLSKGYFVKNEDNSIVFNQEAKRTVERIYSMIKTRKLFENR